MHLKSLHIVVECRGMIISRILIDNGSRLNFCLAMTLRIIHVEDSIISLSGMMVRAFNGTNTSTCGEVDLKILLDHANSKYPLSW